jgi:hypothetical protein
MATIANPRTLNVMAASTDETDIPTPTPTHYQQKAGQLGAILTELTAQIPKFEGKHPSTADFVRRHQNIPMEFIAGVTAAVEAIPELLATGKYNVVEARDTFQFIEAFRPILDRMEMLTTDLKFTLDAQYAKLVTDGLQMYDIAKGFARDPASPSIAAHVEIMRRNLGRTRPTPRLKAPVEGAPK